MQEGDADRQALRRLLRESAIADGPRDADAILDAAQARLHRLGQRAPGRDPSLERVRLLAELLQDKDWVAPPSVRPRALTALAYFAERDAAAEGADNGATIMADVLAEELQHELDAYRAFRTYRDRLEAGRPTDPARGERRLVARRTRLRARIQARRYRDEEGVLARWRR